MDFHGYTIFEDGTILGLHGRKLKQRKHNERYEIKLTVEGKRVNYLVSRLVYYAFNPFDISDKNLCVSYKDDDKLNVHLENLYLANRKDLVQADKHDKIAKLTDEQVLEIRSLYQGKVGVNQHDKNGPSLNDIAKMYGVSKSNIAWIVKGRSRKQANYKLK